MYLYVYLSLWAPRHQHHKVKCTSMGHYITLQCVATSWPLHGKRGANAGYYLRDVSMAHPPHRRVHPRSLPTPPQGTTLRRRGTQRFAQTRSSRVLRVFSRASRSPRESQALWTAKAAVSLSSALRVRALRYHSLTAAAVFPKGPQIAQVKKE